MATREEALAALAAKPPHERAWLAARIAAKKEGVDLGASLNNHVRSSEEQQALYESRDSNPNPVAPPGTSHHEAAVGGDAWDINDGPAREWLKTRGPEFGLFNNVEGDAPHFQYFAKEQRERPNKSEPSPPATPPKSKLDEMFGDKIRTARNGPVGMQQAPVRDPIETAARSGAKVATLGTSDEIAGLASALAGPIADLQQGKDPSARGTFGDVYRADRDAFEMENEAHEAANPMTDFAASISAALATAPLAMAGKAAKGLGAIWQGTKGGALLGGLSAAGNSKADLTKGEVLDAVDDTSGGALIGGTIGGTLSGIAAGLSRLFPGRNVRAAQELGGKAGGRPSPVASEILAAADATAQQPSIASLGANSTRSADSLRRLFARDADALAESRLAEKGAVDSAMTVREGEMVPRVEAEIRNSIAGSRDAANRAVEGAREGVTSATATATERRAQNSLNSQRLATGRESDRVRESLLTGREIPRSRGNNPREPVEGALESMRGPPKSKLITEAKETLAKTKDRAKDVGNQNRDAKELLKPDPVAIERAKMAGKSDVVTAQRSRLMEGEGGVPGKLSQKVKDQLKRDGDQAAQELLAFDKMISMNKAGNEAISRSRPGIMEQLGVAGKAAKFAGTGGLSAPFEANRFLNDRALAKVAKDPALVREVTEMLANGFDRRKLSPALQAVLSAEGANLQSD